MSPKSPTLFLDRDGTINVNYVGKYVTTVEEFELLPGVPEALQKARNAGFKLSVITNQSGVARGYYSEGTLHAMHEKMKFEIAKALGLKTFEFDDIRFCPSHPEDGDKNRKPQTGMVESSIEKLNADTQLSFFIGDRYTDIMCGNRMGLRSIYVLTGQGADNIHELDKSPEAKPFAIVKNLTEAVELAQQILEDASS